MTGLLGPQIKYGKWKNEDIDIRTCCHGICLGGSSTNDLIPISGQGLYKGEEN